MFEGIHIRPIGGAADLQAHIREFEARVRAQSAAMDSLSRLEQRVAQSGGEALIADERSYFAFTRFYSGVLEERLWDIWEADPRIVNNGLPRAFRVLGEPDLARSCADMLRCFRNGTMARNYQTKWRRRLKPFKARAAELFEAMEAYAKNSGVLVIPDPADGPPLEMHWLKEMPQLN